jgi:hypothetical protein
LEDVRIDFQTFGWQSQATNAAMHLKGGLNHLKILIGLRVKVLVAY